MKVWFWTCDTTECEEIVEWARSGDPVSSHISDMFKSKNAAKADMLEDINREIRELEGAYEPPDVSPLKPLKRFPRLTKGGQYYSDELQVMWTFRSRSVK